MRPFYTSLLSSLLIAVSSPAFAVQVPDEVPLFTAFMFADSISSSTVGHLTVTSSFRTKQSIQSYFQDGRVYADENLLDENRPYCSLDIRNSNYDALINTEITNGTQFAFVRYKQIVMDDGARFSGSLVGTSKSPDLHATLHCRSDKEMTLGEFRGIWRGLMDLNLVYPY